MATSGDKREPMVEGHAKPRWLGGLPAAGLENLEGRAKEETAAYLEKCNDDEVDALRADLEAELAEMETRPRSTAVTSETTQRQEIVLGALRAFTERNSDKGRVPN